MQAWYITEVAHEHTSATTQGFNSGALSTVGYVQNDIELLLVAGLNRSCHTLLIAVRSLN